MVEDDDLSMVVIRESPIFAKDDLVIFPPIDHENLQVASYIYGVDSYLESPSGSSSSSSRRSASSSSFSLLPSDSDGQPPLSACEFDQKFPSEAEGKSPPSLRGESPPSVSTCDYKQKSPRSPSGDSDINSPSKPLYREAEILQDWFKLLLVRGCSKLKSLVTCFSSNLRSFYPVLAIVIWWWMRVRARRRRVNGETMDHLRCAIKERDERIVQLLNQIAQMNELFVKHHKDFISRR